MLTDSSWIERVDERILKKGVKERIKYDKFPTSS